MDLKATIVFEKNWAALKGDKHYVGNEGGSRSSKTHSLCQVAVLDCLQNPGEDWSIVRKTLPALKATVLKDLLEVIGDMKIWHLIDHNKSEKTFTFTNGSVIEYFSVDDEQKVRGRKRRKLWINEANEVWLEDFVQLDIRTEEKVFWDYNPSEYVEWMENILPEEKLIIHSTHKDNPFLAKQQRRKIEDLKRTDPISYDIYALGIHAQSREKIYQPWEILEKKPERFQDFVYGLDFGYVHPMALVRVWYYENERYYEQVIHESYLDPDEMVAKFDEMGIEKDIEIIADHSRADLIALLQREGYYVLNADKDVKKGIGIVRKCINFVCSKAREIIKENKLYKHKKIAGEIRDEVSKKYDDGMDAIRYADVWIEDYAGGAVEETMSFSLGD